MRKIFTTLCLAPVVLWGVVFESGKIEDMLPYVDQETWVFLDVDNTMIESTQQLGSAQWRNHIRKKARECGYSPEEVELALDKFWVFVQHFASVKLVDPQTVEVIERLKERDVPVFGLTAREAIEATHTQRQLGSVGIALYLDPVLDPTFLPSEKLSLLDQGVIYCGDNTKSMGITAFFEEMDAKPKKVVFVDDNQSQILELEKTLEEMGIEFVGMRFSGADERVQTFDGDIADVQFSYLPKIVTDEEANEMLHGFINLDEKED